MSSKDKFSSSSGGTDVPLFGAFLFALALHFVLGLFIVLGFSFGTSDFGPPTIYSVTLEGGSSLGGMSQTPKDEKKTPIAPPKNVSAPEPQEDNKNTKQDEKPEDKQQEKDEAKDAELSLAALIKKPTVTPTPKVVAKSTPPPSKESGNKKDDLKDKKDSKKKTEVKPTDVNKDYQSAMQRYLGESTDAGGKGFGAGKLGGNGMGGGKLKPPEFFEYYDRLKAHVKKEWRWYDSSSSYACKVAFEMDRNGKLKNVVIAQSSGSREFDDSVLRALGKADPVPAPPEIVYEDFKSVRMVFDPRE